MQAQSPLHYSIKYNSTITMTQLSSTSTHLLQHLTRTLLALERAIRFLRDFLLRRCPEFAKNVFTLFVAAKDLASFVPSALYKAVLGLAIFSVLWRKLKRWRERRLTSTHSPSPVPIPAQINLQNLGPQYLVKSQINKSFVGNARTDIDSFFLEIEQLQDPKGRDFRDIVFFQMVRSYRAAEEAEQRKKEQQHGKE